jgi:spore germination protein
VHSLQSDHMVPRHLKRWLLSLIVAIAALAAVVLWAWDAPLLSPLVEGSVFRFITPPTTPNKNKVVYGFLPYWNVSKVTLQPELTHLSYFSLAIAGDGTFITREADYQEPGYNKLQSDTFQELASQTQANGGKVELVLTQFNNDDIVSLLSSPAAHQQLIKSIDNVLLAYPISGINIDIEYTGEVTPALQKNLTTMMQTLNQHLDKKYNHVQLSIDLYPSASNNNNIWDIGPLANEVDYLIIMAYDFHRRSSSQAGPVAPLFGGKKYWDSDISEHLKKFLKVVPPEKILLGIPFYGYEWQTTSTNSQALTFPDTGSTASFERVQELLTRSSELNLSEKWNEEALSPYLSYSESGQTFVVYYENSRSISYKLDYVNQLDLGGIAIWALGYEGDSRELWDVIRTKLRPIAEPE